MKTSELQGAQLDHWVARAEGKTVEIIHGHCVHPVARYHDEIQYEMYKPSFDWAVGGPLIEKYEVDVDKIDAAWYAIAVYKVRARQAQASGTTPLQAICRAVVRAAFGDEVPEA